MHDLNYVLGRVQAGDKIKISTDVFGARRAEFTVGWLLRKTVSIDLEPRDVERLKQALRSRRATRDAALQPQG